MKQEQRGRRPNLAAASELRAPRAAMDNFHIYEEIGRGKQSVVYVQYTHTWPKRRRPQRALARKWGNVSLLCPLSMQLTVWSTPYPCTACLTPGTHAYLSSIRPLSSLLLLLHSIPWWLHIAPASPASHTIPTPGWQRRPFVPTPPLATASIRSPIPH